MDRTELFAKARQGVQEAFSEEDRLLVQTVGAITDLDKSLNLLSERLREWYEFYFPELRVAEPEKYVQLIQAIDLSAMDEKFIAKIVGEQKAREISGRAARSMGANLSEQDLDAVKSFAKRIETIYILRRELEAYQEGIVKRRCPNLMVLLEPSLASKLIAQAGSLEKLAKLPAGTVQVLGAEKALFKHLKKHTNPPKHGLIFQHPAINTAPKKLRGKIARALATKIAIAAKADAFTRNMIAPKLKEDFEKRVAQINAGAEQ